MWNSRAGTAFVCVLAVFFAQTALQFFLPFDAPLLLAAVLFYALSEGAFFGLWIGCAAGALANLLQMGSLGASMASYGLIGWGSGALSTKIFPDGAASKTLLPIVAVGMAAFFGALSARAGLPSARMGSSLIDALRGAPYLEAVAASFFLFPLLGRFSYGGRRRSRRRT